MAARTYEMDNVSKNGSTFAHKETEEANSEPVLIDTTHAQHTRPLDRFISFIPTLAFGCTVLGSWEGVAASFAAGLLNGGPVVLVYGYLQAVIGAMALALSIAEMASITPVSGAQYHWSARYAPSASNFWGHLQGWLTVFGWLASVAGLPYFAGTQIEGLLILNYPDYQPTRWQGQLLMWASMVVPVLLNVYARKLLAPFEVFGIILHLLLLPIYIAVLVTLSPRSTTKFVFTEFIGDASGWSNPGVVWSIGLLTSTYTFTGFDGPLHMSEEVKDAHRVVPRTMVYAVLSNGIMAWGWMICLLYTMGNVENALNTKTGYPFIEIFYQATNSLNATNACVAMLMLTGYVGLFNSLASVSRLVWAFARDNGLPYSRFFAYVSPKYKIPMRALFLVVVVVFLVSFIELGSTEAFSGIISLSTLALYASYTLPIIFFTIHKLRGKPIKYGPWRMRSRIGIIVNLYAIVWGVYNCIFLPFPAELPVSAKSLNWSGPVFGFVMLLALLDWFLRGKKHFVAPVHTLQDDDWD